MGLGLHAWKPKKTSNFDENGTLVPYVEIDLSGESIVATG